jgi:hypothetical protein
LLQEFLLHTSRRILERTMTMVVSPRVAILILVFCYGVAKATVSYGKQSTSPWSDWRFPFGNIAELPVHDVVVIGGGLSGSSAAFYMNKGGIDVILAESDAELGGNMISRRSEDGFQWEEGPNSFQPSATILRYAKDLGMVSDLVLADSKLPRFVYWNGALHKLPGGLRDIVSFSLLTCTNRNLHLPLHRNSPI